MISDHSADDIPIPEGCLTIELLATQWGYFDRSDARLSNMTIRQNMAAILRET